MVMAVAVENVSHAEVDTECEAAELARLLRSGWRLCVFGMVYEGLANGALMRVLRAGESFDILKAGM